MKYKVKMNTDQKAARKKGVDLTTFIEERKDQGGGEDFVEDDEFFTSDEDNSFDSD